MKVLQVSVGRPAPLGIRRGKEIVSGIKKVALDGPDVIVTTEGIVGDEQADTRVKENGRRIHGGRFKAVYAYPAVHLRAWNREFGILNRPGIFGENLTVLGATEETITVGTTVRWGDAVLRVSGPRQPCFKLAMHLPVEGINISAEMIKNGRCGWYFEVVRAGLVPLGTDLEIVTHGEGPTIAEAFAKKMFENPTIPDVPD
jgi:MOSC domain-containing protein YiiM